MKFLTIITHIIILTLLSSLIFSLQSENSNENFLRIDEKDKNPEKVPIINVHMEEPDRDPIEVKRIEEERRIERNRIREMEIMEEMDKRSFQQIIALQNSQLGKLSSLEDKASKILNTLEVKESQRAARFTEGMNYAMKTEAYNAYANAVSAVNTYNVNKSYAYADALAKHNLQGEGNVRPSYVDPLGSAYANSKVRLGIKHKLLNAPNCDCLKASDQEFSFKENGTKCDCAKMKFKEVINKVNNKEIVNGPITLK